jgi:hypothetical protein
VSALSAALVAGVTDSLEAASAALQWSHL